MPHTIYSGCNLKYTWEMRTKTDLLWYSKFIDDGIDIWATKPSDTHGTLFIIEDGFRCELERFISALTASIEHPAI